MRYGVNYTPSTGWFYHWLDFRPDDLARDLDTVAELGVDHIRIFPLWPVIQPHRTLIRERALADVETLIEVAGQRGLDVSVDGLQGHLSSFDFLPAWLSTWHRRNLFTDPTVIESTAAYLRRLAEACSQHPNVFALTIGNEVNQFTGDLHPQPFPATSEQAGLWAQTMIDALHEGAPALPALQACYDATWYNPTQPFTPTQAATIGDITAVHSWVFNGTAQLYGADSFPTQAHARYLVELARAFQVDPHRPVWLQEVGVPRNVIAPEQADAFMEATFANLNGAPDLFGITWWASHDVDPALEDFPPLEYSLGLIDQAGKVKPEGRKFAALIDHARRTASAAAEPRPEPPTEDPRPILPLDLDRVGGRTGLAPGGVFWTMYMRQARTAHPRIVIEGAPHA
ncbi:MAG: cellulase family glycosylhydrolase [Propionibacteriaceae bacterium]|nr:cellulase family glycosylhydrolase [Propionibacteriaceae bacterium]